MRYRNILFLIIGLGVCGLLVELLLRVSGLPFSLTHRSGPGQVALYLIGLIGILWFARAIAGVNPVAFLLGYLRDWRRTLAGFVIMFLFAFAAMALLHLALAQFGTVRLNQKSWEALTPKILERTAVALLVVVVLAITEEMIFRGFVLRYLRWSAAPGPTIAAVLGSAFIFSSLHTIALQSAVIEPDYLPLLTGLFMLGVLLGTVYVATGSLACCIGVHAGLLGFKVFQRRTDLIVYIPDWMFGIRPDGMDLRVGPAVWLILGLTAALFVAFRWWLWPRLWIETAVVADNSQSQGIGFRLEAPQTIGATAVSPQHT